MQQAPISPRMRTVIMTMDRFAYGLARHWLTLFIVIFGAWVLTPFLAPLLMRQGMTGAGEAIYFFYSLFCHQLPQRSLFFFGPKMMYSLEEIKAVWQLDGLLGLRQFIGNPEMGYKVAWSDRMISFYGSIWLGAFLYAALRGHLKPLSLKVWLIIGVLPVFLDGISHFINDIVAGTSGMGFRDTNAWLQFLTGNRLPLSFYTGDTFGSFNSDMRWITGILFGFTLVWFLFPYIDYGMRGLAAQSGAHLRKAGVLA